MTRHAIATLSADELFKAWAAHRASQAKRRLGAASLLKYRAIWSAWLQHLLAHGTPWQQANAATLTQFVHNIQARSPRQTASSTVSRTRYWRAVAGIYEFSAEHASALGLAPGSNPLEQALAPPDARSDAADSSIITPQHWQALLAVQPLGQDWTVVRDRAMLQLLLDTAMTVQELRTLRLDELQLTRKPSVMLRGNRLAQERRLLLSPAPLAALQEWLLIRRALPTQAPELFLSRKGLQAASAMAIWHNLSRLISQAMTACGDADVHHHYGPNVLRNAVLLRWLNEGVCVHELARRAGLGSARKLLRIAAHGNAGQLERLQAALRVNSTL